MAGIVGAVSVVPSSQQHNVRDMGVRAKVMGHARVKVFVLHRARDETGSTYRVHYAFTGEGVTQHVRRPSGPLPIPRVVVPIDGAVGHDEGVGHVSYRVSELLYESAILVSRIVISVLLQSKCTHVEIPKGLRPQHTKRLVQPREVVRGSPWRAIGQCVMYAHSYVLERRAMGILMLARCKHSHIPSSLSIDSTLAIRGDEASTVPTRDTCNRSTNLQRCNPSSTDVPV